MQNSDGHQKGPQDHAEGGHGEKTRSRILEQLHSGSSHKAEKQAAEHPGAHRLVADRKQHDNAEKRSEKTRLSRDIERHRVPGDSP